MDFSTYSGLKSAISTELNRTDLDSDVGGFIALFEAQTERQLRVRQMLTSTTVTIDAELEALPADFLEAHTFTLDSNPVTPLEFLTINGMASFKQMNQGTGKPTKYSVIGSNFQFLKAPDTSYTASLVYYQKIPRLSDSVTSNWLLLDSPDIYFYGSLLNSAPYLKEDARIEVWAQLYQNAVNALQVADDRAQTASTGLVSRARVF